MSISTQESPRREPHRLQPASSGVGPLLQRDYWAVIERCRLPPSEVIDLVASRFPEFPPPELVVFERSGDPATPLAVGDELDIQIRAAGACRVRVVHKDACSLTFATLEGHPEAGRITFGAYRNDRRDVIFHIRSRVRSSSWMTYLAFRSAGDPMQTGTWTDFVNSVAITCGAGVIGYVHAETHRFDPSELTEGDEASDRPTFVARAE